MHIVFFGPEGSGKGTQAKLLAEQLHIPILTSGDLVRDAAEHDKGIIGEVARQALSEGKYVADSEMFVLWKWRLKEPDAQESWIMDGFPRNVDQAVFLDDKLEKHGQKIDKVFYLNLPEEISKERLLKRARPLTPGSTELHDSPDRIATRLSMYREAAPKVLDHYKQLGVLVNVNANQSLEDVHKEIMAHVVAS